MSYKKVFSVRAYTENSENFSYVKKKLLKMGTMTTLANRGWC